MKINENSYVEMVDMSPFFINIILKIIVGDICISFVDDIDYVNNIADMSFPLPGQVNFSQI